MTLAINSTFNIITIVSDKLDSFILNPSSYQDVKIILTQNCATAITKIYTSASPITGSGDVRTNTGVETIHPSILGLTVFPNSIISVEVKLTTLSGSSSSDKGVLFIDNGDVWCAIDTDCVDKQNMYYALEKSIQCSCSPTKACTLYENITSTSTTHDCNC